MCIMSESTAVTMAMQVSQPSSMVRNVFWEDGVVPSTKGAAALSTFVDGTTPSSQKMFLTIEDGWETCMAMVTAVDSDMMHIISHRNHRDPATNLKTSLFLSMMKRSRAVLIPKPKTHSPWRILKLSTLAGSIQAGFINHTNAKATALANGSHQLSGQASGIDAAVPLTQSWADEQNCSRARLQ